MQNFVFQLPSNFFLRLIQIILQQKKIENLKTTVEIELNVSNNSQHITLEEQVP